MQRADDRRTKQKRKVKNIDGNAFKSNSSGEQIRTYPSEWNTGGESFEERHRREGKEW